MARIIKNGLIKVPTQPKDFDLTATGLVFRSYDNQPALEFNIEKQDGTPADLLGATLRLLMYVHDEVDGTVTKEPVPFITKNLIADSFLNGHVKYILPEALKAYNGMVEAYVYIEYPDGSTSDNLGFTFRMKRSAIDGLAQDKADYFIEDFKQLLDGVKQEATDAVNEALAKVEVVSENVSSAQNDLTILEDRIDQANQEIDKVLSGANEFRTDIDTLKINKADKTFVDAQLAQKVNKSEVTNKLTPKGNADYDSLPTNNNSVGDYYYCSDGDGTNGAGNYVWNGAVWYFGGTGDEGYSKLNTDLSDSKKKVFKNIRIAYSDTFDVQANTDISGSVVKVDIPTGTTYTIEITDINNTGALEALTMYEKGADGLLTSLGSVNIGTIATVKAGKNVEFLNVYTPTKPTADAKYRIDVVKVIHTEGSIEERLELFKNEATFNSINATAKSSTKNGVNLTSNGDGTYTVNGTATARTNFHMFDETYYPKNTKSGEYKLIGCPPGGSLNTYFLEAAFRNIQGDTILNRSEVGKGLSLTLNENAVSMYLTITIMEGETVEDLVFKPMLTTNMNATYDSFVGYTGESDKINETIAEVRKDMKNFSTDGGAEPIYWENVVEPPYWVFHLDCARKYFTVANVKLLIDKISKSGFNQIQLHFSEDSGFRLELDNMMVTDEDGVSYDLSSALGGTESPDKWYTQADMDSIISYAQSKNIDVVPSFDMPGHMGRILYRFPQFKLQGSNTLDITNDVAVKFAKAVVKKYCKYFSSRGSHYWNIGYDEIVGSKGFDSFYNEGNYKFVVNFANTLIDVVKEHDLIPRMYNEAVYYNKDYNYYVSKDVELYYWYTDWAEYTLPDVLQKSGYKLINNSYKYYWILDKEEDSTSVDVINQTELLKDFFNRKTDKNGYGAVFAIWCDSANTSISKGDGGDGVVSSVSSLITAFGNAISRAYEQ